MASAVFVSQSIPSAAAAEIIVKHSKGETALPSTPEKILVFDIASLDTLDTLGVEVDGVPSGAKPKYLSKYAGDDVLKIGSLFEPDFEAVSAAQPDLIIVGGRSSAKFEDLSKIAPTIDMTIEPEHFVESAKENVETLAEIFGKQAQAEAALEKLDSAIADLKGKAASVGKGLLVLTTGGKMSTYGAGSRFGVLFSDYGVQQADGNIKVGMHGQPIAFEYILEKNPDWLFVIDRDAAIGREGQAAERFLDNEIVGQTTAWKQQQVVYLDAAAWYLGGGGLTAMQNTVDQLTQAFDAH
ncbi:MAG: siderophore ABC transporter substrate-binding protein [Alphaproteobacteria bacterium]|nr:siderophore ABC transporter substrate-binding protein [Alphaproteobacteria bacterium]MBU1552242.1 siderophore ABC transporter substrate-binding protein [Alphaproteobacteria bacterium]MBU2336850.1 siderophore ABC transporter substrate-binding protein [Alphaproteobacteria bacterium]MBU2389606.1 siderophore ABC transporter substrate-binding protein [Alphaproteobacteria bacterium]